MSQGDQNLANQSGASFRTDLNAELQALVSNSSGASAPATTYAYQWWADTTNGLLKQRNAANTGWIIRGTLAETFVIGKSSNFSVGVGDFGRLFECTAALTVTLTAAATLGDGFTFGVRNDSSGTVVIDPNASETIDGSTTVTVYPGEACKVVCNGTAFYTVGRAFGAIANTSLYMGRNRLLNGDMRTDQRFVANGSGGPALTNAAWKYSLDRWTSALSAASSGTLAVVRTATGLASPKWCMRIARSAGSYVNVINVQQVIESENCFELAGQAVTVSFLARKGSAYSTNLVFTLYSGTGTDEGSANVGGWTGFANTGQIAPSLTTSFQRFSMSVTLGASVSELSLWFNTGNFVGTGGANDYVEIADVALDPGIVVMPFERRLMGIELALLQRYYEKSYNVDDAPGLVTTSAGEFYNATVAGNQIVNLRFRTPKRANPAMVFYNPNSGATGSWRDVTAAADRAAAAGSAGMSAYSLTVAGSVAGNQMNGHWTADSEL